MATGRPFRTEYDRTQNYKDYMKNLDLQIKNNKTNYDANILYKQTGVPTQPLDTRTYAEKQADIAQLKVNLRSELRILLDDNVIGEVFQELNDEQIQFLAGMATSLIAELKPKYTLGMTSHHFIDILDKKIRHEHDFSQMSEMMGTLADQLETIADNMVTGDKMNELIDHIVHSKYTQSDENERIINNLRAINEDIVHTHDLLQHYGEHTGETLESINEKILNPQDLEAMIGYAGIENAERIERALVEQFQTVPTIAQVDYLIDRIQQADRAGDRAGLDAVLQDIRGDFAGMGDRIDAYNEELTGAIEQSATAQAEAMRLLARDQSAEMRRMRLGLGAEIGGVRGDVEGLRTDVERMNEGLSESITGLRGELTASTVGVANQLTALYDNVSRQSGLIGDLQGGQERIRESLQAIQEAINMIQGLGEVNVTQLLDMENRIAGLNTQVMTMGVSPETIDELQIAIAEIDDELRLGRQEQKQGKVGISMEQQQRNEYELIQRLKLIAKPLNDVTNDDPKTGMKIGEMKKYIRALFDIGITELNETMNTHLVIGEGKYIGKTYIASLKQADLKRIKDNYSFVSAKIGELIETPPPIFAEAYSEKVPLDPFAGGRPSSTPLRTPTTSEAIGDVFRRTTPRGVSPRGETPITMSSFETPSPEYRTTRSVPTPPSDYRGNPEQLASTPPHIGKSKGEGILTKHRGVGVRMTGRGIAPKEKYIPLGKYLVNIHKLEHNNIISFKSPNHKSTNIQSKRVSQPVADILLHIVNGTLDEIVTDNLSEDDISYLFQLIKKCELENFLDGKAEDKVKTKTEQEIHNFYVLQGEIVAGNDNPQIIREFKAILLTMMNEGKLSKKEAGDVLIQMSLLGI